MEYSLKAQYTYSRKMAAFKEYNHPVQESWLQLIKWFGRSMFNNLYQDNMLLPEVTPRDMLAHLTETYIQGVDNQHHMRRVTNEFQSAYNPKIPVETYFIVLVLTRCTACPSSCSTYMLLLAILLLQHGSRQSPRVTASVGLGSTPQGWEGTSQKAKQLQKGT